MSHIRQQIRTAAETLLNTSPTTWARAYGQRTIINRTSNYLLVYVESETDAPLDIHSGHILGRDLSLTVRGYHRLVNAEKLEDILDDMSAEIETKLTTATMNAALSNKIKTMYHSSYSSEILEDENETQSAEITLTWQIQVMTIEGAPETLV